ncbi:SMR family transporter [Nocardioides sp. CCNWLW239]|uniref:DMT family transporter n=1 Tax=Nocardioides sp. CCNWLW239 TaxID=3128902 RepID=UPI0030176027
MIEKAVALPWLILVASGVLEAVWANALSRTEGFQRPMPSLVFLVALVGSMAGLGYAVQTLPVGTAYAVWVGIGVALTIAYSAMSGQEPISAVRVLLLVGLVGCIVGLKITD